MELKEFLEKFLPEYEQKIASYVLDEEKEFVRYIRMYFPEALQNFSDSICEKQRELCDNYVTTDGGTCDYDCRNAEQPKIEEL